MGVGIFGKQSTFEEMEPGSVPLTVKIMSLTTKIILGLIVLHLLLGFGWLIYKLSPRKGKKNDDSETGPSEG